MRNIVMNIKIYKAKVYVYIFVKLCLFRVTKKNNISNNSNNVEIFIMF